MRDAQQDEITPEPRDPKASLARRANRVRSRLLALHLLLTLGKLTAGVASGSYALVADSANSLREVGTALPSLFVTRRIGRRRHTRHPYDHGRMEAAGTYGASFVVLVLAGAFGMVAWRRLFVPHAAPGAGALVFAGIALGVSEGMYRMQRRLSKQLRSPTLELHPVRRRTDMVATLAVLLAAVAARVGGDAWWFGDDIATMVVAGLMAYGAGSTLWRPGFEVVDRAPRGDIAVSVEVCARRFADEGVLDLDTLVTRRLGSHVVVEARLLVAPETATGDGARLAERVRRHILYITPFVTDAVIHVTPATRPRDTRPASEA